MNYIKPLDEFLSEAISLKMYKENLPKLIRYDKSEGYKNWDNLFGKDVNRITIPLKYESIEIPSSTPLMDEINSFFLPLGYKINSFEDYLNNKVYKIGDTKNPMKIGGLLNKSNPNLFKKFDVDTERKEWKDKIENSNKELKIIISRHPYDLLGMASGRDWSDSSCMRLGTTDDKVYKLLGFYENEGEGANKDYIFADILSGTLVAYVVKSDDNNINKPLSRLLIKPYINEKNPTDILWVSADNIYGKSIKGFKSSVDNWIGSWQGDDLYGRYCIKGGLYSDGKMSVEIKKPISKWNNKDREEFLDRVCGGRKYWTLNPNGEVDVKWSVNMNDMNLTEIPVKFGRVEVDFHCSGNNLTTLKNCPNSVNKDFWIHNNKLTSLEFAPTYVGGYYICENNRLTSLEFAPTTVSGSFYCNGNKLTSLEFTPTTVGGTFNCSDNKLTSLQYCPTTVGGSFECSDNKLTSLQYCPDIIKGGSFNCSGNKLTSLQYCPTTIDWTFECSKNQLTSLEYSPTFVGYDFNCEDNQLISLRGCPTTIGNNLNVGWNKLTSLDGFPTYVGGDILFGKQSEGFIVTKEDIMKICEFDGKFYK
jgi:hypothetical protein